MHKRRYQTPKKLQNIELTTSFKKMLRKKQSVKIIKRKRKANLKKLFLAQQKPKIIITSSANKHKGKQQNLRISKKLQSPMAGQNVSGKQSYFLVRPCTINYKRKRKLSVNGPKDNSPSQNRMYLTPKNLSRSKRRRLFSASGPRKSLIKDQSIKTTTNNIKLKLPPNIPK